MGDFSPSALQTKDFEVSYKTHKKGEKWPEHYHLLATEINFLIKGSMTIAHAGRYTCIYAGEIFVVEPAEIIKPYFDTDCELVVVKTPSVKGDKYEV